MTASPTNLSPEEMIDTIWTALIEQAEAASVQEPDLKAMLKEKILNHSNFQEALQHLICDSLKTAHLHLPLNDLVAEAHAASPGILPSASADLVAIQKRDPASMGILTIFLFFKGFVGLQAYRIGHWLWTRDRKIAAAAFQSRIARCLDIDIHPGARIGKGVMMDHAQGIVIGETALIEDDVSLLHNVTLGGTGTSQGDRSS